MNASTPDSMRAVDLPRIVRLLEGLELSLADDMTLGGAVCRGFDPAKDFSPIVAFLRLQQRYLDLCAELNYKPTRKLTGMPHDDEPNDKTVPTEGGEK